MKITQYLWFEKDMAAAIDLYTSLIPGSRILSRSALQHESPVGSVSVIDFILGDQSYTAFEAGPFDPFNHSFSILIGCDTQAEIDHLWEALGEGGVIEQCGWLRDRWGLCWQIVPVRLTELLKDPDPGVVQRVTKAMLGMVKLDIEGLEAAAKG
ncbi:MAG: VOC family protein [Caulobacter sp.]|nr:VOC family protein [Caulobacter sp.]